MKTRRLHVSGLSLFSGGSAHVCRLSRAPEQNRAQNPVHQLDLKTGAARDLILDFYPAENPR